MHLLPEPARPSLGSGARCREGYPALFHVAAEQKHRPTSERVGRGRGEEGGDRERERWRGDAREIRMGSMFFEAKQCLFLSSTVITRAFNHSSLSLKSPPLFSEPRFSFFLAFCCFFSALFQPRFSLSHWWWMVSRSSFFGDSQRGCAYVRTLD